jgi:hypothetical protein
MEESLRDAPAAADTWRDALAQTIEAQRRKIGEQIASHRDRLRELESRSTSVRRCSTSGKSSLTASGPSSTSCRRSSQPLPRPAPSASRN